MNFNLDPEKVFDVLIHWGDKMPMMTMEECGELIQAISKMERKKEYFEPRKNLIEEIRDVFIGVSALMMRYNISDDKINEEIEKKLNMKKDT